MTTGGSQGRLLRVGLTGGIGSGKSTVARLLRMMGGAVYEADLRAKALMVADGALRRGIVDLLGTEAYDGEELNRAYIASRVFGSEERLVALNALVHPAVERDFDAWVEELERRSVDRPAYAVEEAAVLIESGAADRMDRIVVVTAPLAVRIERVVRRDGASPEQALARVRAQMDEEQRLRYADHRVTADDRRLLVPQVVALHAALCRAAREEEERAER